VFFLKFLLSSVVYDAPLRDGEMTQADLISIARDYELAGLELRDTYWQGGDVEIEATIAQLWAEDMDVVYAVSDVLVAKDMDNTLHGLAKMVESIYLAAKMGAKILRINAGATMENLALMSDDRYRSMMARVEEESKDMGVVLALENPPKLGAGNIMTLNWVFTQYPFIKLTYDTANWCVAGESPVVALDTLLSEIRYVHLKDAYKDGQAWQFTYPGGGEVPFKEIMAKLVKGGYEGVCALEFPGGNKPRESLEKAIRILGAEG
jgi:L-ribulose-5-phosphate 3-epimerase